MAFFDKERAEAKSLDDLIRLAKKRGWGLGWAFAVHKSREQKKRSRDDYL